MYPVSEQTIRDIIKAMGLPDISAATIRQICSIAAQLEKHTGEPMVHLEIGNPGIPAFEIGVNAECDALKSGVANKYPDIAGIPEFKTNASEFLKAFLNIGLPGKYIIPTVGSMQGTFTVMLLLLRRSAEKDSLLFLDPGFPAQRNQARLSGFKEVSFDIYNYRGKKLEAKLEEYFSTGKINAMVYSNPNNPAWTNLTDEELEIIGRLATKYDVFVMEDLAYFGMDFRNNYGEPYKAPYIPTVAKYTDNYIIFLSASKIFSYAGQRISMVAFSPAIADRHCEGVEAFFHMPTLLDAYIFGVLYAASSGTAHSAQHAFAAMMKSACEDSLDFVEACKEYGRRGARTKKIFTDNGFHIVYDKDGEQPIADGFFFTAGYGDLSSEQLQEELLRYGVASISLPSCGSKQNGLRVCPSMLIENDVYDLLAERLEKFSHDHTAK